MNFFSRLVKSIKGSGLVEKILITAFSISGGAAVIVYGVNVVKESTTAEVEQDDIAGKTYRYNQLANFNTSLYTNQIEYLSSTKIKYIGNNIAYPRFSTVTYIQGHKYLFIWENNGFGTRRYWLNADNYNAYVSLTEGRNEQIFNYTRANCSNNHVEIATPRPEKNATLEMNVIDLTEWFGAGSEPSSVSDFRVKFPNDFYPTQTTPIELTRAEINGLGN